VDVMDADDARHILFDGARDSRPVKIMRCAF
jgi:hypothetical protein